MNHKPPWVIGMQISQANYMARKTNPPPPSPSLRLGTLPTGPKSEIRVSLDEHAGRRFVNIRAWYIGKGKVWMPTRRGMTLAPERVPELVAALHRLGVTPG